MNQLNIVQDSETVLSGSFKRGNFIDLLKSFGDGQLSGNFYVSSKDGDGFIVFYKGYIAVVFSHGMYESLRDDLIKKNILDESDIKEILELQKREPKYIFESKLVKSGKIDKQFLYDTMKENSLKVLKNMLYWDGIYRFYNEDFSDVPSDLLIDIKSIQKQDERYLKDVSRELSESRIHSTLFTRVLDLADEIDNISNIRKTYDNVSKKINSFLPKEIVIIIEEDPTMSAFLSDGLTRFNYDVENYGNNQEAFKRIEELEMKNIPAVVVLDLSLRELEDENQGYTDMDFLQGINENFPHIPVVIIASINDPKIKMKCLFIGASYFIIKPDVESSGKGVSHPDLDLFVEEISYYIWNVIKTRRLFLEREEITFAEEEIINYLLTDERFLPESEKNVFNMNILVVDDEPEIRKAIKDYLGDEGFSNIDTAENGEEAVKQFEESGHDVVIVDIVMPKKNGIEVLREIKARSPGSQVIIITGNADKNSAIAAVKWGAFDYIEKPFDYALISRAVKKASEKKLLLDRVGLNSIP